MNELRQDRISGQWVTIAQSRGNRPQQVAKNSQTPPGDKTQPCPFCPGNESELPGIVAEYPAASAPGWQVRVTPNRYAAFKPEGEPCQPSASGALPAYGYHEVIIETPRHEANLDTLRDDELLTAMRAYRDRFSELMSRDSISTVTLFRNYGPGSGASIVHAHAQIIATAIRPEKLKALEARGREHFAQHGSCLVCDELERELGAAARIVEEGEAFVTLVPYAPQYVSEIWIVPKRHQARFDEMTDGELEAFGFALRGALRRLRQVRGDVAYNFAIDSAARDERGAPHVHWRLRLAPHISEKGGFELGTDIAVVASSPEQDAAALRAAGGD